MIYTHAGDLAHADGSRRLVYLRRTGASWKASDGQRYNARTGTRRGDKQGPEVLLVHEITRLWGAT